MRQLNFYALTALLTFGLASARADIFNFNLGVGNSALTGGTPSFTGPYESVNINLTSSTTAVVTFTSDTQTIGGTTYVYLMGDGGSADVNVNAAGWSLTDVSTSNSGTGFSTPTFTFTSGNISSFGSFNEVLKANSGFPIAFDTLSFLLTNTSGTWASAANVLTPNADGNIAAAHVFVTTSPADQSNGAIVTGFDTSSGQIVPEPSLLGLSLAGIGVTILFNQRRHRRQS